MKGENFGKILRQLRIENNLTQKQLSQKLDVSDASIRDWEIRGIEPNFDILRKLSEIFKVSSDYLLGLSDY